MSTGATSTTPLTAPTTPTNMTTATASGAGQPTRGAATPAATGWQNFQPGSGAAQPQSPPSADFDLTGPGAAETFDRSVFQQPSALSEWLKQYGGAGSAASTVAQQGYRNWQQNAPVSPNLDPYYDMAFGRASNDINKAFGARGMFNSSEATNTLSRTRGDLAAQQAREEADWALKRSAEERGWAGLASGEATAGRGQDTSRMLGLGQLTGVAGQQDLAGAIAGFDAAHIAQQDREGRIGNAFDDTMALPEALAPILAGAQGGMIESDAAIQDQIIAAMLGLPTEAFNQGERGGEKGAGAAALLLQLFETLKGNGSGGGSGGSSNGYLDPSTSASGY